MANEFDRFSAALAGRYRVERELGRGGMATVYLAEDLKHHRRVAIKVLKPELATMLGPDRFLREIEIAAHLTHPHILPLYDSGEAAGLLYYVMPYIRGESLRDRLNREKQLPLEDALRIAREVTDGLSAAHSYGLVHRDVKPENILLSEGHAVVSDFGIARAITEAGGERLTVTGVAIGTPEYMSPEQATGESRLDARSDLYSLGCVLYEMLAGKPPFTGTSAQAVVVKHAVEPAPPLRGIRGVPSALKQVILRCLAKAPDRRYRSAAELQESLAACQAGLSVRPLARRLVLRRPAVIATIAAAAVTLVAVGIWMRMPEAPAASVAVLPFADLSPASDREYFSDGITEEVLNALARIPGLRVPGRTTSFSFKGRSPPIRQIARELGVAHVLTGSVRTDGERLRITAQLVDGRSDAHIWSQTYDREMGDVFAVQEEIASAIVRALQMRLTGTKGGALVRRPTEDPEAYGLYLQGRYLWHARGPDNLKRALAFFEQAIARDPEFARAHAAMAEVYMLLPPYADVLPDSAIANVRAAAQRALAIDPEVAEAHSALAVVSSATADWDAAEREYRRAVEINPTYAPVRYQYCYHLMIVRRFVEAFEQCRRSVELDSLSVTGNLILGQALLHLGRPTEALVQLRRLLDIEPGFGLARAFLADYYAFTGLADSSVAEAERLLVQTGRRSTLELALVGNAFAVAGRPDRAETTLAELERRAEAGEFVSPIATAYVRAGLGERDEAIRLVALAVGDRSFYHDWLRMLSEPGFDLLRTDPRFQAILAELSLL